MEAPAGIAKAHDLVMWINDKVHEIHFPNTDRNRIAGACFAVALEHHHAITILLKERMNGSAFALVRSVFEAYVRGNWLLHCATDEQLDKFIKGVEPPKFRKMIDALEALPDFNSKVLSHARKAGWSAMCSFTHTGALQVQRWVNSDSIMTNHSVGEIEEMLRVTNSFALLAGLGVVTLADNVKLAEEFLVKSKSLAGAE